MRINSRFKDYYDLVMGQGIDTTLVYNRFTKKEPIKCEASWIHWEALRQGYTHSDDSTIWMHKQIIGFCGKLHVVIGVLNKTPLGAKEINEITYCYSEPDFFKFVSEHYDDTLIEKYQNPVKHRHAQFSNRYIEKCFSVNQTDYRTTDISGLHEHFKLAPIFVISTGDYRRWTWDQPRTITYNPRLSDFNFAKVMDPYTTYQELNMYLSNIAVPIKPIPHIDDVTMAEIKGFDKYSFRKERTSKKWKPKRV